MKNNIRSKIYVKLEYENLFGSIKDRVALQIISKAERNGFLMKNSCIIEATSGNMGIALAGISKLHGYRCKIVMPENMSKKRKLLIQKYGAELILSPFELGMQGSIDTVQQIIYESSNYYYTNQFNNCASIEAHQYFTAPEILKQLHKNPDIIIAGIGTGATISGIGTYFKERNDSIKIIGVLPSNYPHKIQGIGAGFTPPLLRNNVIDQIITVEDDEAFCEIKSVHETEKLKIGISSGAVIAGMKKYIKNNNCDKKNIVLIFADGSDRYE